MNISCELDCIMRTYGLYQRTFLKDRIESAIREVVSEYTQKYGKRIILRAQKFYEEGYPLLNIISDCGEIVAVVDKNPFSDKIWLDQQISVPMMNLDEAENLECDVYIINTKNHGKTIFNDVTASKRKCHALDLYKEVRTRYGIAVTKPFDEYKDEEDISHNRTRAAYLLFCEERCEENLIGLLSVCLSNRDFVTFYQVMDEAGDLIAVSDRLKGLKEDIDELLDKIRKQIQSRKQNHSKDIIMHWIDSAGYEELDNFPLLKSIMEKGLVFEKAYAVAPYTLATETCLFYGDMIDSPDETNPEDIMYRKGLQESRFYHRILDRGYAFHMVGNMVEDCIPEFRGGGVEYTQIMGPSSFYYWKMLERMIQSDKPIFGIVGCLAETHEPWMSPGCDVYNSSFEFNGSLHMSENKIKKSAAYFDKVLNFYTDLLGNRTIHIYMSDHGKWEDIALRRYSDFAMHTILGITNMGVTGRVTNIFSYQYFANLVDHVFQSADQRMEEHIFGDMDIRSSGFRAAIKSEVQTIYEKEEDIEKICAEIYCGYAGIKTAEDTYIRLNNGKEIYYVNTDKEINRIDDADCYSRIGELRKRLEQQNEG